MDFADLERCILGGVMGDYLSSQVSAIFDEFSENFKVTWGSIDSLTL